MDAIYNLPGAAPAGVRVNGAMMGFAGPRTPKLGWL
jgi:hypothetical protein